MPSPRSTSRVPTLARKQILHHPLGIEIETPLLVPSISSKGLGIDGEGASQAADVLRAAAEIVTEAVLVSAYDLHYNHIPPIEDPFAELFIVDSGGYEIADIHDLSTVYKQPIAPKEWSRELHRDVLDKWPAHIPAIFVSYDHPKEHLAIASQIERARETAALYPSQLHCLLIKPTQQNARSVDVSKWTPSTQELGAFDIIGITEKELGVSIIKRMQQISELRYALDDAGVHAPIHVFGSLDPISSVLYFVAGAEVFDGLTWIRFGYLGGAALYRYNYAALRAFLKEDEDQLSARLLADNYYTLSSLQDQMRKYLLDMNVNAFRPNNALVDEAFRLLRTKVRRLA